MLHLVLAERPKQSFVVLTVDHGLREGSRAEAEQVAQSCSACGVEHHTLIWEGKKPATGIQARARQTRYDLMTRWCTAHDIPVLLTAHTMDDQAETVVMRQKRTTSPKSLAGIWPETEWNGIRIIRPLLGARREDLRNVLRAAGVSWSDDPSNDNPGFERVRVRATLADADVVALAAVADVARAAAGNCLVAAGDWLRSYAGIEITGLVRLPRQMLVERDTPFLALSGRKKNLVKCEILKCAIHMASGGAPEPDAIGRLLARILDGQSFRSTLGGAMIAVRRAEILLGREPGRIEATPVKMEDDPILWDGRFRMAAPAGSTVAPAGPRCPKPDKNLPAFVLAGLPVVTLPDGRSLLPHFQSQTGVSVSLGERFRL